MADLRLTGVSEDGTHLLLVGGDGAEHRLALDASLREAVRGGRAPGGKTPMESTLRPRDIQARIRAGATPEAVAEAAQTSVEKIMPFAAPVLAEREHVAQRAQRSSVRRRSESGGSARTLGEAAAAQLRSHNLDPTTVEWDAWRREDGRWTLSAGYATAPRTGTAHFTFDMPGNYVLLEDDDARWLVGDLAAPVAEPADAGRDDLERARRRRMTAARAGQDAEELPLGVDAIELVSDEEEPVDSPIEAFLDPVGDPDESTQRREAADAAAAEPDPQPERSDETAQTDQPVAEADPEPEAPARRPVRKRGGRASVPSWDEIMFGGGKQD